MHRVKFNTSASNVDNVRKGYRHTFAFIALCKILCGLYQGKYMDPCGFHLVPTSFCFNRDFLARTSTVTGSLFSLRICLFNASLGENIMPAFQLPSLLPSQFLPSNSFLFPTLRVTTKTSRGFFCWANRGRRSLQMGGPHRGSCRHILVSR